LAVLKIFDSLTITLLFYILVLGNELLQLHQDKEFLGVQNYDSNFSAIAINGCQGIKTTDQLARVASKQFTPIWLAGYFSLNLC